MKDEDKMRAALSWHPIGRFGEPEDVAYGVLYLASDESKFMTGALIFYSKHNYNT